MATHDAEADPRSDRTGIGIRIDGAFTRKAEGLVSACDRGFMLGDGVWEGIRLYGGRWVFLDGHPDRLFEDVRAIDIGRDRTEIRAAPEETRVAKDMEADAHARRMLTRGRKAKPFQHPKFSVFGPAAVIIREHSRPGAALRQGVRLVTVPQARGLPMSRDPRLRSHSRLNCVLARLQAERAGGGGALTLDPHGFVNTANACNFFLVRRGEAWTSAGDDCMNGVTRAKVIAACRDAGILVFQKSFSLVEAYGAEEAFLTGTFGDQIAVSSRDGRAYGEGAARGPTTRRIQALCKAAAHG